jgi:carboxymethylenebutenolidase
MADIQAKSVKCAGGMPAYVAVPSTSGKVPIVIVLHERYGFIPQHFTGLAERFARKGFVCIAPDCFYKHPDQEALHRGDAHYEMTDPESVTYMNNAIDALRDVPQADATRIVVMGVCQTGRHPLVLAAERPVAAALVWYGAAQPREFKVSERYPKPLEDIIAKVDCPVLGHFGEADHIISIDDVIRVRDCLERHKKSFTVRVYRDAPHGWLNDAMPGRYRPGIAERALADQFAFLDKVLAPDHDKSRIFQQYDADISTAYDFGKNKRQA